MAVERETDLISAGLSQVRVKASWANVTRRMIYFDAEWNFSGVGLNMIAFSRGSLSSTKELSADVGKRRTRICSEWTGNRE